MIESWEIEFESALPWDELQRRWNAAGPFRWDAFENDERGSYLRALLPQWNGKMKAIDGPPRWTVEIVLDVARERAAEVRAEIDGAMRERLLPALKK